MTAFFWSCLNWLACTAALLILIGVPYALLLLIAGGIA